MIAVPADTPVTIPEVPVVAMPAALLLQVPPLVASLNVVVEPEQIVTVPVMAAGKGLTVMPCMAVQPVVVSV